MCKNTTEVGCLRCRYKGYTSFKSCSVPYTTTNTTRLKLVRTLPEISQRAPCSPYGWRARCTTPAFGAIRVALFDHCMSERHRTKKQLHCLLYDTDYIRHTLKPPDWSPRQACKFSSRTFSSEVNVVKASARSRASLPPRISLRTQFSHLQHDKREPWSWFAGNSRRVPDLSLLHILFSSEIDMYEASSN